MDHPSTLERDAARALASFAADAYGIAIILHSTQTADRLVDVYRRALLAGSDEADRHWFEFYVRLEGFVRTALGRMAPSYPPETTRALLGFAQILEDDFGHRVRDCVFALAPESVLP